MSTVAESFALAWTQHQAGNYSQAEQQYRQIVASDPRHVDAWCLLGAVCQAQSKFAEAEVSYRQVIQLWPGHAIAHNGLGILLAQQGKLQDAASIFEKLLAAEPGNVDALNNLGLVYTYQRRFDEATVRFQQALQLRPDFAAARDNLNQVLRQSESAAPAQLPLSRADAAAKGKADYQQGVAFYQQGLLPQAVAHLREALKGEPDNAEGHAVLGNALFQQKQIAEAIVHYQRALRLRPDYVAAQYNLGVALQDQGKHDDAAIQYRNTLRLDPKHALAHNNLGLTLLEQSKLEEAAACFQRALQLDARMVEASANLGTALERQGKIDEAIRWDEEALRMDPKCVAAWNNLGMALKNRHRLDEALVKVEHALTLDPNYPLAHWNRAVIWLLRGDFERGWPEYEWRWVQPGFGRRSFTQPLWDGSNLDGRTILLYAEQGLGDTLQFIRYVRLVKQRGGTVIVQCHRPLLKLLESVPGIDRFEIQGAPYSAFDVHAALLSLPAIFRTTLANMPAAVPYLHADAALVEQWREKLASRKGFKIGIAWQGNPSYREDRQRSIPLTSFAPLAQMKGVNLVSLQKGHGREQLQAIPAQWQIHDLGSQLDEAAGAFMDTAAVMKNLDLVITSDTAIPHLAGALGVPVWVALPHIPDWRWLLEREDSPWYPSMRLVRQRRAGDWHEVFERIAAAVSNKQIAAGN